MLHLLSNKLPNGAVFNVQFEVTSLLMYESVKSKYSLFKGYWEISKPCGGRKTIISESLGFSRKCYIV
jgi:hypothetical protein